MKSFCSAKAPHNFSAKKSTTVDTVSLVRLTKSITKDFVKPIALRKAKIVYKFGFS